MCRVITRGIQTYEGQHTHTCTGARAGKLRNWWASALSRWTVGVECVRGHRICPVTWVRHAAMEVTEPNTHMHRGMGSDLCLLDTSH
jgi:hypothetical protein